MKKQCSIAEKKEQMINRCLFWMMLLNLASLFAMILLRTDDVFFFGHFVISGIGIILLEVYKLLR